MRKWSKRLMAQYPPSFSGGAIARGARLTDFVTLDLTVEGLASGGMGLVAWGHNALRGGEMSALKLLKPDRLAAASSPEARKAIERQFEEEALTWCHLWHHQCVITTTGLTRLAGLGNMPIIELEYAPNGSLREQLQFGQRQRRPLAIKTALAWALHIASALAHIHQRDPEHERPDPLIHCDLKPENVLLNEYGWALLTDLGLTRAYAALAADTLASISPGAAPETPDRRTLVAQLRAELQGQGLLPGAAGQSPLADTATLFATHTLAIPPTQALMPGAASAATPAGASADELIGTRVAGSPPYMAPEQWRGLAKTVPATDVYAFGVLLFELFAGYEAPMPFPRDPRPYLTPALFAHALATGYDAQLLAWHAAHTDAAYRTGGRGQGTRWLSDAEAREAALRSGPCATLLADGSAEGRRRAEACLEGIAALVERCLAYAPEARPRAEDVMRAVQSLAVDRCGLPPLDMPQSFPATPQREGDFWSNLGTTYASLGRDDDAVSALRKSVQHDPNDPVNWVNLGGTLSSLGAERRKAAQNAERLGQREEAEQRRAESRQAFEEALETFRQAQARVTPKNVAAYPNLPASLLGSEANALSDLERYGEAVNTFERALAHNPEKHNTRFNLALTYTQWAQALGAAPQERVTRLQAAQRELAIVLAATPEISGGRSLAERIARALADPSHRIQR